MRALVTVTGQDRVGIIASVCNLLAERNINILDINQTVMEEFFTMAMLVDTCSCTCSYEELRSALHDSGAGGSGRQNGHFHPHSAGGHFPRHAPDLR